MKMKATLVETEAMTAEQCWAEIEAVGELLTVPGLLQAELKKDPVLGVEFKENTKQILHIVVDNFDVGVSPDDTEEGRKVVEKLNSLFFQNQVIQQQWNVKVLTRASMAMQQLDLAEMMLEISDVDPGKDGIGAEGLEELKSMETETSQSGMARIDPRIMQIMNAGINAAGGQLEFARIQHDVIQSLPEQFNTSPEVRFTSQMIGSVLSAIETRAQNSDYSLAQIRTTIEMMIGSKQALSLSYLTAYHFSAEALIHTVCFSAQHHVMQAMSDVRGDAKPEKPKQQVNAEATHVAAAKSTSFNFEGNRTVN